MVGACWCAGMDWLFPAQLLVALALLCGRRRLDLQRMRRRSRHRKTAEHSVAGPAVVLAGMVCWSVAAGWAMTLDACWCGRVCDSYYHACLLVVLFR